MGGQQLVLESASTLKKADFDDIVSGKKKINISGDVKYKDTFGVERFCYFQYRKDGLIKIKDEFIVDGQGNYAN